MKALDFKIEGMDCAEEVATLKREVGPLVGGEKNLAFDILHGKMTVIQGGAASLDEIMRSINRTGMKARLWNEAESSRQEPPS
ncbi:MAG: hypothetical protein ABIP12_00125, partial [Terriglobales bacterium]